MTLPCVIRLHACRGEEIELEKKQSHSLSQCRIIRQRIWSEIHALGDYIKNTALEFCRNLSFIWLCWSWAYTNISRPPDSTLRPKRDIRIITAGKWWHIQYAVYTCHQINFIVGALWSLHIAHINGKTYINGWHKNAPHWICWRNESCTVEMCPVPIHAC